jgi:hypothetical protein
MGNHLVKYATGLLFTCFFSYSLYYYRSIFCNKRYPANINSIKNGEDVTI